MLQVKHIAVAVVAIPAATVGAFFALSWLGFEAPGPERSVSSSSPTTSNQAADGDTADVSIAESTKAPVENPEVDLELQSAFGSTASPGPTIAELETLISTSVRTTAYTHTEADHIKYGNKTALGTVLRYTPEYHSVAADWSRFPLGTKFRMKGVDRLFVVDDYGKALVGSRTVDIYFPSKKQMNHWGVRHVDIDVVEFGNFHESRKILAARANYKHCREMLSSMTSDDWWKNYK